MLLHTPLPVVQQLAGAAAEQVLLSDIHTTCSVSLQKAKDGSGADALRSGFSRITGMDADGMGSSYKVMAITDSSLPELAGFEVKA